MELAVRKELDHICQVISETVDLKRIYLFGSYAYGSPNQESDYDLYVVIPDGLLRPLDAAAKIRRALFRIGSRPLDIITCYESRFQQRKEGPTLERTIAREGVLLYERNELEQGVV